MPDVKLELISLANARGGKFNLEQFEKFLETVPEKTQEEKDKKKLMYDLHYYTSNFNAVSDGDEFISSEDIENASRGDGNENDFTETDIKEAKDKFVAVRTQQILEEKIKENKGKNRKNPNINRKDLYDILDKAKKDFIQTGAVKLIKSFLKYPQVFDRVDENRDGISNDELNDLASSDKKPGISPRDLAKIKIDTFVIECPDSVSPAFRQGIEDALKEMPSWIKEFFFLQQPWGKTPRVILGRTMPEMTEDFRVPCVHEHEGKQIKIDYPVVGFYDSRDNAISITEDCEEPSSEDLIKNYGLGLIVAHELLHALDDNSYSLFFYSGGSSAYRDLYSKFSSAYYADKSKVKNEEIEKLPEGRIKRWIRKLLQDGTSESFSYIGSTILTAELRAEDEEYCKVIQQFFPRSLEALKNLFEKCPELITNWKAERVFKD